MRTILFAAIGSGCLAALPAAAHAGDDSQYWQTVNVGVDLGHGFRVTNETVLRTANHRGFYEVEDNLLVGYKLNRTTTVWAGYTHDPNYSHGDFTVMEHRFRQQVTFDNFVAAGSVKFSARLRGEERWRDGVVGTGYRMRPFVKATMPIAGKTLLVASNESFFNLNRMAFQRQTGLDRMRTFVGVNTPLVKHVTLEAGYLNQHGFARGGPDTDDHVASVALNASF